MARDINDTVVLGFGSWSDVNALPTLGFGQTIAAVPIDVPGMKWEMGYDMLEWDAED